MRILSFDVESVGLHGQGFAVGWVVLQDGQEVSSGYAACPIDAADGAQSDREWVEANVCPHLPEPTHDNVLAVRDAFWAVWLAERERGAVMLTDCGWPVEARFLSACIDDDPEERRWQGPYPLLDVASLLLAAGMDPLGKYDRLDTEQPAHHPTCDARQSARVGLAALAKVRV